MHEVIHLSHIIECKKYEEKDAEYFEKYPVLYLADLIAREKVGGDPFYSEDVEHWEPIDTEQDNSLKVGRNERSYRLALRPENV